MKKLVLVIFFTIVTAHIAITNQICFVGVHISCRWNIFMKGIRICRLISGIAKYVVYYFSKIFKVLWQFKLHTFLQIRNHIIYKFYRRILVRIVISIFGNSIKKLHNITYGKGCGIVLISSARIIFSRILASTAPLCILSIFNL